MHINPLWVFHTQIQLITMILRQVSRLLAHLDHSAPMRCFCMALFTRTHSCNKKKKIISIIPLGIYDFPRGCLCIHRSLLLFTRVRNIKFEKYHSKVREKHVCVGARDAADSCEGCEMNPSIFQRISKTLRDEIWRLVYNDKIRK